MGPLVVARRPTTPWQVLVLDGLRVYECSAPLALTHVHTFSLAHVATSKLFPALLRDLAARTLPRLGPP
jgi:hypothetical protein